jgi:hypothetical protein
MMAKIIDMETRDMVERRAKIRRRVLKAASLTFFGGYCTRESIARNLCQNGARLDFEDTTGVPHEFTLMINGEAASRTAHQMVHGYIGWRAVYGKSRDRCFSLMMAWRRDQSSRRRET